MDRCLLMNTNPITKTELHEIVNIVVDKMLSQDIESITLQYKQMKIIIASMEDNFELWFQCFYNGTMQYQYRVSNTESLNKLDLSENNNE